MAEFVTPAEFRADLQRQFDAFDDVLQAHRAVIAETEREREMVALQIATIDRVMAMQPQPVVITRMLTGELCQHDWQGGNTCILCGGMRPLHEQPTTIVPQATAARQRQDVRGPVLALLRNSATELSADEIGKLLPNLKPASIISALRNGWVAGTIKRRNGLYWTEDEQASASPTPEDAALAPVTPTEPAQPDDRHGEGSDRHPPEPPMSFGWAAPAQADTEPRVPRHVVEPRNMFSEEREPDARALNDASPEAQAMALRAAVLTAGPAGLPEENSWVAPTVIADAIEAGWLHRTEHDRRLWLRDAEQGAGQ